MKRLLIADEAKVFHAYYRVEEADGELERLREELSEMTAAQERVVNSTAHLHRIEEAARDVDKAGGLDGTASKLTAALRALRAALEEDVPLVTDAERAEALRVREAIEERDR